MSVFKKSFVATFIVLTIISSLSIGVKVIIQRKKEAEFSQYCQQLKSLRTEVINRINSGKHVSDAARDGAYMAGRMAKDCP